MMRGYSAMTMLGAMIGIAAAGLSCLGEPQAQEPPPPAGSDAVEFTIIPDVGQALRHPERQRKIHWNVIDAATDAARNQHLSREGIVALGASDVLLVRWPTPRMVALQTRDLPMTVFVVPFTIGADFRCAGELVELRPAVGPVNPEPGVTRDDLEPMDNRWWAGRDYSRPWSYDTPTPIHGFLLFRGRTIHALNLPPTNTVFGFAAAEVRFTLPPSIRNTPADPDPPTISIDIPRLPAPNTAPNTAAGVTAKVVALTTNAQRYGHDGFALSAMSPVETAEQAAAATGALFVFDRAQSRPYFSAGLAPPYDLGVFDARDRLARVISVRNDNDETQAVKWPTMSREEYRYLVAMPAGWFAAMGLLVADGAGNTSNPDGAVVETGPLRLPATLTRLLPEPTRYEIRVGNRTVFVEVVYTEQERNRGLMWRRHLPPDCGMLFLYPEAKERAFWMMGCFFDQSIAYIYSHWAIARICDMQHPVLPAQAAQPHRDRPRTMNDLIAASDEDHQSVVPVSYCLEMPIGWYRTHNLNPSTRIDPGPVIREFTRRAH